jgi:hypothetical protein
MKIDADEKELLESVERGEWKAAGGGEPERTRYARYAQGDVGPAEMTSQRGRVVPSSWDAPGAGE